MSLYPNECPVVEIIDPNDFSACVPRHAELFLYDNYFCLPAVRCMCGDHILLFDRADVRALTPSAEALLDVAKWSRQDAAGVGGGVGVDDVSDFGADW